MAFVELELVKASSLTREEDVTQPAQSRNQPVFQNSGDRGEDPRSLGKGEGRLLRLWSRTHGGREMLVGIAGSGSHLREWSGLTAGILAVVVVVLK